MKRVGVSVVNGSAPTAALPVRPHSISSAADMTNSRAVSVKNWNLKLDSRFWNPLTAGPSGGRKRVQVEPTEIPKLSVMRLEYSAAMSSSAALSPFLNREIVGSDNSSATQGSSMLSVAGKNRLPTKQCA